MSAATTAVRSGARPARSAMRAGTDTNVPGAAPVVRTASLMPALIGPPYRTCG